MQTTSTEPKTTLTLPEDAKLDPGVLVEDRRLAPRIKKEYTAHVTGFASRETLACAIDDISEGGLFVCLPQSSGVCVGQRCEVVLAAAGGGGAAPDCAGAPMFATVVRTAPVSQGTEKLVGAGLRFDQPIYL